MKDVDKIKEKSEKDEVKSTIGIVFLFLVVFGIIAFAIIELTSEYLELKRELNKNKITKKDEIALDENSKKYGYTLEGDKISVREIEDKAVSGVSDVNEEKKKEVAEKDIGESQQAIPQPVTPKVVTPQTEEEKSKKTQQTFPTTTTQTPKKPLESKSENVERKAYDTKELYAVQLMALKSEEDAKKAVERYKNKIDDIYYIKADLGEKGVWYRIRCCNTDSLDKAKSKANEIEKNLNLKPLVVRRK